MAADRGSLNDPSRDKRAMSPAISTTIITSAIIVMLLVTMSFSNNYLSGRMAENEFSSMEQFMQTIARDIDDVAWMEGRTQTIRFASKFGQISFKPEALTYSLLVNDNSIANFSTGIICFNMPINIYGIENGYFERILPSFGDSFLQSGTSALVALVFVIERVPMNDGSYLRIVVAPCIRTMNFTISAGGDQVENHVRFYLPKLLQGALGPWQSITLTASRYQVQSLDMVSSITLTAIPNASLGYDNSFFRFQPISQILTVQNGSKMEFYTSDVTVSLGVHA
jgi:hypothetical protein